MTKFKNTSFSVFLLLSLVLILAVPVQAYTIYTTYSSFLADFPDPAVENFEDSILQPGLSVVSTYKDAKVEHGVYKDRIGSGDAASYKTTWAHSDGFTAWGGTFEMAEGGSGLLVSNGSGNQWTIPNSHRGFWGIAADNASEIFEQVQLSAAGGGAPGGAPGGSTSVPPEGGSPAGPQILSIGDQDQENPDYFFDNLAYEAAPVPEPATMLLLGIGLLGIAGISRKKL